ncbi:MAG TPA: hypothetical protein VEF35_02520 [Candidatus Bathyarchaeia archaeon]|nr:hypothetical protein [Candidatus Bathyarchaeia archaeon]
MYIDFSSILLFILGIIYLVLLPGYLILVGLNVRDLDVIETLTTSFGTGVGVLTAISVALSLTGSVGLTASSLVSANAAVLVAFCSALVYKRYKRAK